MCSLLGKFSKYRGSYTTIMYEKGLEKCIGNYWALLDQMGNSASYYPTRQIGWRNMCSSCPTIHVEWSNVKPCWVATDASRHEEIEIFNVDDTPQKTKSVNVHKISEESSTDKSHASEDEKPSFLSNVPETSHLQEEIKPSEVHSKSKGLKLSEESDTTIIHKESEPSSMISRSSKEAAVVQDIGAKESPTTDIKKLSKTPKILKVYEQTRSPNVRRSSELRKSRKKCVSPTVPKAANLLEVPELTDYFDTPDQLDTTKESIKREKKAKSPSSCRKQTAASLMPTEMTKIEICVNDAGEGRSVDWWLPSKASKRLIIGLPIIKVTDDTNVEHIIFDENDESYKNHGWKGLFRFKSMFSISSKLSSPGRVKKDLKTAKEEWVRMKEKLDRDVYTLSERSEKSSGPKRTRSAMNLLSSFGSVK